MCTTCGCASGNSSVDGKSLHHGHADHDGHPPQGSHHQHQHQHHHQHQHQHRHDAHGHADRGDLHFGNGPAGAHAPGLSQTRMIQIEEDILGKNDAYADANRRLLADHGVLALNLVSSPGSGKTTLLTRSLQDISTGLACGVIEGDQQTANDAERIRATGVEAVQINTGKGCHLDAHMVGHALEHFDCRQLQVLFIENVGNLVCPAAFDLGEACKVAILSVTEGEDKPLKYPDMFYAADLLLLNKTDLLPYLDFDVEQCIDYARRVNPDIEVIRLSARSGEGMSRWYDWISRRLEAQSASRQQGAADAVGAGIDPA